MRSRLCGRVNLDKNCIVIIIEPVSFYDFNRTKILVRGGAFVLDCLLLTGDNICGIWSVCFVDWWC